MRSPKVMAGAKFPLSVNIRLIYSDGGRSDIVTGTLPAPGDPSQFVFPATRTCRVVGMEYSPLIVRRYKGPGMTMRQGDEYRLIFSLDIDPEGE